MGANKNSSRRSNSTYTPNSQPNIPTRVCQGRVVTTDLPTLGTNPKQSQSESETQEAKDLATLRTPGGGGLSATSGRTVREAWADHPKMNLEPPVLDPRNSDRPWRHRGLSVRKAHHADCPRSFGNYVMTDRTSERSFGGKFDL
jgi:hypothetical protein